MSEPCQYNPDLICREKVCSLNDQRFLHHLFSWAFGVGTTPRSANLMPSYGDNRSAHEECMARVADISLLMKRTILKRGRWIIVDDSKGVTRILKRLERSRTMGEKLWISYRDCRMMMRVYKRWKSRDRTE